MRTLLAALALLVATTPLTAANIWFDVPNPTSRTPVTAHVVGAYDACGPVGTSVQRNGNLISITLQFDCPNPLPFLLGFDQPVDLGVLPPGVYEVVASPNNLLLQLGEAKLTVQDAAPPLQILPNVSPTRGDSVTINAPGIAPVCAVGPCPEPIVLFDGQRAVVERLTNTNSIIVRAPAHARGTVDVTVTSAGQTRRAIAAFHYFDENTPADPAFFEPVLFPVMISGPGAFGAQWSTEATMRNDNDYAVSSPSMLFERPCAPQCDSRPKPLSTTRSSRNEPVGFETWLPRQAMPRIFFGLLVKDLSREAEALGTEIPVVRENEFFARSFTILNVPGDPRYRVALRLYQHNGGNSLHVRVRPLESEEAAIVDTDVALSMTPQGAYAYGVIGDLLTTYPQLAGKGPLRVEIEGASPQRTTWAFVSVTNNVTQRVTIISPQ